MATINILSTPQLTGALVFTGTNAVGPQLTVSLPQVQISPGKELEFIDDKMGTIDIQGEVLADDDGVFGTVDTTGDEDAPSINNVYIGTGTLTFNGTDVGNCLSFKVKVDAKEIPRWNHRGIGNGVKKKDANFVNETSAMVSFTLDEYSAFNLKMILLDEV
jgi:hypothetical protein